MKEKLLMHLPNRFFLLGTILFTVSGCYDVFTDDTTKIIGNIYVNRSNDANNSGLHLIFFNGQLNHNIVEENVISISGNDSVLFVRAKERESEDPTYYIVSHFKGDSLGKIRQVDLKAYEDSKRYNVLELHFESE